MTAKSDTRPIMARRGGAWWGSVALIAAMLGTFLILAAIGADEAERGVRVLGFLAPAFEAIRQLGSPSLTFLAAYSTYVGLAVTAAATALALAGLRAGGKRAVTLFPLAAGVCLASWGQILLLGDRLELGAWLYGCGIACAVVLGFTDPLHRLAGFPQLPPPTDGDGVSGVVERSDLPLTWRWECLLIFAFFLVALLMRLYALTEMPAGFDLETIGAMIESRTLYGLQRYVQFGLLSNAPGIVHLLTNAVFFRLFGTSPFTVRLTATCWGVAAVPLFYWLVRRIAGVGPAVVSTVLFIAAPEQLFWSRTENSFFAPVTVAGLITAHLGLWLVERFSFRAALVTAVWMPACRYFYVPTMILFTYPLILYGHALVFVRAAWRKARHVVPVLAAGLALWIFSLSILFAYVNGGGWRFVNPTIVYGAPAWRKQGEFRDASLPDLVRLQASSVTKNLGLLLQGMVETDRFATHWYIRHTVGKNSSLNVGLAVVAALGAGYLAGQLYERRAAALLLWLMLGLLPACLGIEPGARRMAVAFPAIEAIAGVMLAALVRIIRARAGRRLAWLATSLLSVAVIGIVWTSLASHFLIAMEPPVWLQRAQFAKPVFEDSNLVLTDVLDARSRGGWLLGNLDRFVQSPPCWQYVDVREWPGAALRPHCDFTDDVYGWMMPPERVAALKAAYHPRRISFLLDQTSSGPRHVSQLRELYPSAKVREYRNSEGQTEFVAFTVDLSDVTALHSAALVGAPPQGDKGGVQGELLANVPLVQTTPAAGGEGLVVRGGVLLEHDGWYRFGFEPECSQAVLKIDGHLVSRLDRRPLLAGVHPFEITLPSPGACQLPLDVLMQSAAERRMASIPADMFVSPAVAGVAQVQAPPVATYAGYGNARIFAQLKGTAVGLGVDARGRVSVLVLELGTWRIRRFDAEGHEEASWPLQLQADPANVKMVVDADGSCVVAAESRLLLYGPTGELSRAWQNEVPEWTSGIALWHRDGILLAVPRRNAIILEGRDGKIESVLKEFKGGPGKLYNPVAVSAGPNGEILVIEDDGQAILFRNPGGTWNPEFVRAFSIAFANLPVQTGGIAFDGRGRILVPDRSTKTPLVYTVEGERVLAESPERDLSTKGFQQVAGVQVTSDRLYVLEQAANRLWVVSP